MAAENGRPDERARSYIHKGREGRGERRGCEEEKKEEKMMGEKGTSNGGIKIGIKEGGREKEGGRDRIGLGNGGIWRGLKERGTGAGRGRGESGKLEEA